MRLGSNYFFLESSNTPAGFLSAVFAMANQKRAGKKTDILDRQWIRQLHSYGLLRASFRQEEDMCALRPQTV